MSSFSAAASGPSLTGGTEDQTVHNQIVYHLNGVSYAPDSDLLGATDTVNGVWSYGFNVLNQLTQTNCTAAPCIGGSVSFDSPVAIPRGRGLTPVFNVSYSSAGSHPFTSAFNEQAQAAQRSRREAGIEGGQGALGGPFERVRGDFGLRDPLWSRRAFDRPSRAGSSLLGRDPYCLD